jgi:hypothetical protein
MLFLHSAAPSVWEEKNPCAREYKGISGMIHADIPNGLISYINWVVRIEFVMRGSNRRTNWNPCNFEKRVCHCERSAAISRFSHGKRD